MNDGFNINKSQMLGMHNSIFENFRIILRKRLRRVMRGYRALKNSQQLNSITSIKRSLTVEKLSVNENLFSKKIFGVNALSHAELIARQYLLVRIGGLGLNKALLYSVGKEGGEVIYPLPKCWRKTIESHNFKVSNFWCALLWKITVFLYFGFGVIRIIKILFSGLHIFKFRNSPEKHIQYVYFDNLTEGNFPIAGNGGKNIFTWYAKWLEKERGIQSLRHSIGSQKSRSTCGNFLVEYQESPIPNLVGLVSRLKYLCWGFQATLIALLDMFRGHWCHAFLLNQVALMGQVIYTKPDVLAKEYLFHNSCWMYKPLWTYEAEVHGSMITFYFYSTNCQNFKIKNKETLIPYGWEVMNWRKYLVWDKGQANFIRKVALNKDVEIIICGPIWFEGNEYDCPTPLFGKAISVFDVSPRRYSLFCTLVEDIEYYIPDHVNLFCNDISDVIKNKNLFMLWKVKRDLGSLAHPRYRYQLKKLSKERHVVLVEPSSSAFDLIKSSIATISIPYTSTALIARSLGKPSVYYDSTGLLNRSDEAAHGIQILQSKEELDLWISRL